MERRRRWVVVDENALQVAGSDIGLDLPGRHAHYSGALFRRRYEGVEAIHPEPAG